MRLTRREFVGTSVAILAAGKASASDPPGPVRQSLAAFSADPDRVASLRKGVAAMKALPASDHRSWFFQAATHAYSDALYNAELTRDPKLADVDRAKFWNQCPHFGRCSADFVIWHRAYLHYFERTLRAMSGDPTLALPYWDYSRSDGRAFPAIYVPEFLDAARRETNPLYHPNRERSFTRGLLEISASIGEASKTRAAATFFHEAGAPGFGGDVLAPGRTQIGLLEQRPHNDIHVAVGGVIGSENGAMAEITTAAFDPIFWAHHANIDRMWSEWASRPGKSWGPAPSSDWFDERPWVFIDSDGAEVTVSRREAVAMASAYDVDYPNQLVAPYPPPPPPLPAPVERAPGGGGIPNEEAPSPAMPPMVGAPPPATHRRARHPVERELLASATPLVVAPRRVGRRKLGDIRADRLGTRLDAPVLGNGQARVYLELADISFRLVPSSGFAVYLDAAGLSPSADPVGLIDIFGATHHAMHAMGAAQRFEVTAIFRRSNGPFTVRIEPYALLIGSAGNPRMGRPDAVTIGSVRLLATPE